MGVRLHVRSLWASRSEDEVVYEFDQDRILIGRGRGADVRLPHRAVSLRHATIELSGKGYTIVDHTSSNGTRVSGAKIVPGRPKPLRDADRIELGGFGIVFRCGVAVTTPTSAERTASLARRLLRDALDLSDDDIRPSLSVMNGPGQGEQHSLPDPPGRLVIGRGEHCDICLRDGDASREHAELSVEPDGVRVRDLDSKNGVTVGGRPVRERLLEDGDEIRIGDTILRFQDPASGRVRALEQGDDAAVDLPSFTQPPPVEAAPERADEEEEEEQAPPALPAPKRTSIAAADLVIYLLASTVFALSVLGLIWLLRT